MCGRYVVFTEEQNIEIREIMDEINRKYAGTEELAGMTTGEIRPSNIAPIIDQSGPELMKWSYYNTKFKRSVINARSDEPKWGTALRTSRIAVPTNGFYEWTHPGGKAKDKYLFLPPGEDMLYLAGIYVNYTLDDGRRERRYLILTTDPNESLAPYHNRMPVHIASDEVDSWINDASATNDILRRPQPQYVATPMNPQQISMF